MGELRLLSYNVRSLRDDRHAVAAVIRSVRPDVVAVQEAPRFLRWRSKRAALARESGLVVATADRPAGLMLMTTVGVTVRRTSFTLLPKSPRLHQRAVCAAELRVRDGDWSVACVHFSTNRDERLRHLPQVYAAVDALAEPVVLAGDINERPVGPTWHALSDKLHDAFAVAGRGDGDTSTARHPHQRIDGVFVSDDVTVVDCSVVRTTGVEVASDHLPVLAVLRT